MGTAVTLPALWLALFLGSPLIQESAKPADATIEDKDGEVAATLGEETVLLSEVESLVSDELARIDFEYRKSRHQLLDQRLHDVLERKLLEKEAEETGKSVETIVTEALGNRAEISDTEVDVWYASNKDKLQGRTKEELAPQIKQYLADQARNEVRRELYNRLAKAYDLHIRYEPFRVAIETEGHPTLGPKEAPVTLVEFSDFECPYCGRFFSTLKQLRESYPDKVRVVFRQFPLDMHPHARKAAEASLCAFDQNHFWEMHDLLFQESSALAVDDLKDKAKRLGLDTEAFAQCLDSGEQARGVVADLEAGVAVGVTGTPALFLNGQPLEGGAIPFELLRESIEKELSRR